MEEKKKRRVIVAITGGICSGKSTIMKILEEEGAIVISCDSEIKKIKARPKIARILEQEFSDAAKDNRKLAEIVFSSPEKKEILESILYPELDKVIEEFIESQSENLVFVEIPLLYEKGKESKYDKVILARCSLESQRQRAMNRGISMVVFERIVRNQFTTEEKENKACYVVDTDQDFERTHKEVLKIYSEMKSG